MLKKERSIPEEGILPTPSFHRRIQKEGGTSRIHKKEEEKTQFNIGTCKTKEGKFQLPNPPKLELPFFHGDNPQDWLRKCCNYFMNYQISEGPRLEVIEIFLEGRTDK